MAKQNSSAKRERIDTGNDKRYARRDDSGQFNEYVGRSHAQDQKREAENTAQPGHGDQGDRDT